MKFIYCFDDLWFVVYLLIQSQLFSIYFITFLPFFISVDAFTISIIISYEN